MYVEESDRIDKITDGFQYDSWQQLSSVDTFLITSQVLKKECLESVRA